MRIRDELNTGISGMSTKLNLLAGRGAFRPMPERFSRFVKIAVTAFAILYMINGTGAAAGYANALHRGPDSSAQRVAELVWVGVTWPVVVHDMTWAAPLKRI